MGHPPMPVFEESCSPIVHSNDGYMLIVKEGSTGGWVVVDTHDNHVQFFTMSREIADAFVHGYDYGKK